VDKPTDVLSFSQDDPLILGDIVISVDTATRQALDARWPLESELSLLGVHGILHLMGYDDETESGATDMEQITRRILANANVQLPAESHPFFQRI
jgi:probable rRNA maturation factor